jgi:hypothetical protein
LREHGEIHVPSLEEILAEFVAGVGDERVDLQSLRD